MKVPSRQTVLIGDMPVGVLGVTPGEGTDFRFLADYIAAARRPVLGQKFFDDLSEVHRARTRLPPWFANLLPEGTLRKLVEDQTGAEHEYQLLYLLRDDLPGNVHLRDTADAEALEIDVKGDRSGNNPVEDDSRWKFSLAGVQLKFSAIGDERGLTVPTSGRGGDWIVKLADGRFDAVPQTEFATMSWARGSGIDVPTFKLVDVAEVMGLEHLPASLRSKPAFAILRFDRPHPGMRVHMEDFAQVIGRYPERKYRATNYESLARVVHATTGWPGLHAFVRRLVFVVASGNGDAHLKNWSLLYPDGVTAVLSPAYDLVSTIQFIEDDRLAMNLGGSKAWQEVSLATFRRLAAKVGVDEARVVATVEDSIEAIRTAWREHQADFGFDAEQRRRLDAHMARVPLLC